MSHDVPLIGTDGRPLPVMPPERDPRLSIRVIRVMFYVPGFTALLLLKTGEPTGFGITIEFLMLASAASVVAGLFIATDSTGGTSDTASRVGVWSGALVLELLGVVSFLNAVPALFHQLANSELLHKLTPGATPVALGFTELIPALAIFPFMLYQLAGFGTLHFVLPKPLNWGVNLGILALIVAAFAANRAGSFEAEKALVGTLIAAMVLLVFYGVLRLRQMQQRYDDFHPEKIKDKKAAA